MNAIYKEMLLNTIKNKALFMLMRSDESFLSVTYNRNRNYPYHVTFFSGVDNDRSWIHDTTLEEVLFILYEWDVQFDCKDGVFEW